MAKYDATKFYWLQLKEDFFDEDAIDWLEEQPNGKEYSLFYLKLCLKSLRTNGVLIRRVGNMLVPYDHVKLGELTKTNSDTVLIAMNLLIQIGLVQKLENGELYMTQVEHMIGSQSKSAFKKQQQRLNSKSKILIESGQEEDNCPPKIEIEKEEEKEDKIDKKDKRDFVSTVTPNILTNELIKVDYINANDLYLDKYNELIEDLINEYSFDLVRSCLWYFIKFYKKSNDTIDNRFAYFQTTMLNNVNMIDKRNSVDDDKDFASWLTGCNDSDGLKTL